MIRSKDLNEELKALDDKAKAGKDVSFADVLKAVVLVAKVLRDVRSNQVTVMRKVHKLDLTKKDGRDSSSTEAEK